MSRKSNVVYFDKFQRKKAKTDRVTKETLFTRAIGRAVEGLRKQQKLSQQFVAERLGLHQTAMCRIEKGLQHISLYQFIEFCSLMRIPFVPIIRAARKFVERHAGARPEAAARPKAQVLRLQRRESARPAARVARRKAA